MNWNYPTNLRVGAGRIRELDSECKNLGMRRPLLVSDEAVARLPFFNDALDCLQTAGITCGVFTGVRPNPTGGNVTEALRQFRADQHDGVIALGGGSALDVGKAVAVMAHQSCSLWDLEDAGDNWKNADIEKMAPCVAIPTTAGTGSEVGRAALIVHEEQQRKVIIFHARMLPATVILDPDLTLGLPASLTAATGMDALSHNLEAYCSPLYHPMAEGIALEGIRLIHKFLPAAVADGSNVDARLNLLVASTMGATAFQKGLGAMHALAHPLGAIYDAHHGMLNAILMPYVLRRNRDAIADKMAVLARSLGLAPEFDAVLDWVLQLREAIGIPHSLSHILTADERFEKMGAMAWADPSAGTNPVELGVQDYQQIAEAALAGHLGHECPDITSPRLFQ